MGFRRAAFACLVLAFGCGLSSIYARAPTGDLTGVVEDESGGVVQRAKVTATNAATGMVRAAVADETGTYWISVLPPGEYSLTAEAQGLQKV